MSEIIYYTTVVNNTTQQSVSLVGTFSDFNRSGFTNYTRTFLVVEQNGVAEILDTEQRAYRELTEDEQQQFTLVKLSAISAASAEL